MSKSTNTSGLDIRFKINSKEYRLRSSRYDFILEEVKVRKEGDNAGEEWFDSIGSGSTLYQIFTYLYKEHHLRMSEIESVQGMVDEIQSLIDSLRSQMNNITVECFIHPDDKASLVKRYEAIEAECERLKSENQSLRRKK